MKKGFTLAEVLITLGIIGVVAAMTIPTLVSKSQQRQHVVAWRKAYAEIYHALRLMQADEAQPEDFVDSFKTPSEREYAYVAAISHYIKTSKICHEGKAVEEGCIPKAYPIYHLNGNKCLNNIGLKGGGATCTIILDGTLICFDEYMITFDVNGFTGPNTWGKDLFFANIDFTNYAMYPAKGYKYGWGQADGVIVPISVGNGTCKKANSDFGTGCSYYYLHNMP